MVLVDTSVLIDYLRGKENKGTAKFQTLLDSETPYGINSFIYLEVLQGVRSESDFRKVKSYLDTQTIYDLQDKRDSYAQAAQLYFKCRQKGITVNSSVDFLIAQTALENDLYLLHNDSDFKQIAKVTPLKFW